MRATSTSVESNLRDQTINVRGYEGINEHVLQMADYLDRYLKDDLFGAYVHGSLATSEEVGYSDFDALVILKTEVLEDPNRLTRVTRQLKRAQRIMFDYDPLQHHGWFSGVEPQLTCWPGHYFPPVLFSRARAMFPRDGHVLRLRVDDGWPEREQGFREFCNSVIVQATPERRPRDAYKLKCLLSQFMLLPAAYVQLRDREDVFKRESFERARGDFAANDWASMERASEVRRLWPKAWTGPGIQLLRRTHPVLRRLGKLLAPPIPPAVAAHLTDDFFEGAARLARCMRERLGVERPGSISDSDVLL